MYKWKSYNHLSRHRMEEIYLNMIKFAHDKSISNTILNEEKLKFASKIRNKMMVSPPLTIPVYYSAGSINKTNKTRKGKDSRRKGRDQIMPVCRWYDPTLKRP